MSLYRAFKDEESKDDEVVLILEYLSGIFVILTYIVYNKAHTKMKVEIYTVG